jgi:hypothetical protein
LSTGHGNFLAAVDVDMIEFLEFLAAVDLNPNRGHWTIPHFMPLNLRGPELRT